MLSNLSPEARHHHLVAPAVLLGEGESPNLRDAVRALERHALEGDERASRGRRALSALTTQPSFPDAAWEFGLALAWVFCGLLYSSRPGDRSRRERLIAAVYAEAARIKMEMAA